MPVKTVDVSTTELVLVEANDKRTVLAIANAHDTQLAYITDEQGAETDGFIIFSKAYISLDRGEGFEPEKKYWVYASGASTIVHVLEQFQKFKEKPGPGEDIQDIPPKDPRM